MMPESGPWRMNSEGESCHSGNLHFPFASAASEAAPQAIQVADRFHVCKNLTEATQLLLARCQAEIAAARRMEEPAQDENGKPVISIEEWRPKEPVHVEKVRLTRRAGRKTRVRAGGGKALTGVDHKRDGMPTGHERTNRAELAGGWNLS
jgi:transposase